jgi:signal transduction histidine kinase/ligand-binding sensor domain-containing protein
MEESEPVPLTQEFTVQRWTRESGLPQNSVKVIRVGPDGLLWGACGSALWRFDGVRFASAIPMPESNSNTHSSTIMKLEFLDRDRLFVGRIALPPLIYQNGWSALSEFQGKRMANPYDYAVRSNRIALITEHELAWSEGSTWQYWNVPQGVTIFFKKGCFAPDGSLWVAAAQGLYHLTNDLCTRVPVPVFEDDFAYEAICPGTSNRLWVFRNPSDFACLTSNVWIKLPPVQKQKIARMGIVALVERNGNELWAGGQNGLYRWDGSRWNEVYTGEGLYPPGINDLIVDQDGAVWAATEGGGLLCFRERKINILRLPTGKEQQVFTALHQASDGSLYVGVAGRGLWRKLQDSPFTQVPLPDLSAQATVMSLAEDPTGALLIGALGHHLLRMDSAFQTQPIYPGPKVPFMDSGVRALLKVKQNIWVGTQRGVMIYTPERELVWPPNQPSHTINALAVSADGSTVYAASETEGVLAFSTNPTHTWTRLNKGLPETCVEALRVTQDGKLWAGGLFGLASYADGQWQPYSDPLLAEGMRVVQILEDDSLRLWLGTTKGILRRASHEEKATHAIPPSILLETEDGLADIACSGGFSPAGLNLEGGKLLFPTQNGLACIDQKQAFRNPDPGHPIIDEVACDGRLYWKKPAMPLSLSEKPPTVRLPIGAREITLRWLNRHARSKSTARFQAQLNGPSAQDAVLTQQRQITFEHLSPGAYTFTITPIEQMRPAREPSAIHFVIPPYWWQHESVQLGLAALLLCSVGGLGWWGARRRAKKKLQQLEREYALERERDRIARDIHDDLGASLTQIALLSELAQADIEEPTAVRAHIDNIFQTARTMTRTMDEIVWAINPKNDTLDEFVVYLGQYAQDYLRNAKLSCRLRFPEELPACTLTAVVRHNVFLVVKEVLKNIVCHACAREVMLELALKEGVLMINIRDNGCGIPSEAFEHARLGGGNGLPNMRKRMADLHGTFVISGEAGKGTEVMLSVPV